MDRVFEHYHLSLIEREQANFLWPPFDREEWLRSAFQSRFSFRHKGSDFHWVPKPGAEPFIVGTVERLKSRVQHKGPEEHATEFIGHEWQGSLVVIDPRYQKDGQKVAFELDRDVGLPHAILDSLAAFFNDQDAQYTVHVKALFNSESFWRFADRHGGLLRYVTFDFVVPNMFFGAKLGVKKGLSRVGTDTGAQGVKVTLESEDGVRSDSENVRDAMEYAEQGNANVTAKSLNGDRYSSTSKRKTVKMRSILDAAQQNAEGLKNWLVKALGRDQDDSLGITDSSGDDPASG